MLMRSKPILSRFLLWIIIPMILVLSLGYGFLLQSLPQTEGVLYLEGLGSSVKITRDEHAIPHILASDDRDAFFALGYLHAQERLWQMDYKKRLGRGRLSEILGIEMLALDQFIRGHGMARAAKSALETMDESSLQVLEAYAAGINAWIDEGHQLPIEYYILDTEPEHWKPEDSILMIKLMALTLGPGHNQDLNFDLLVKELGIDKANEISPNVNTNSNAAGEISASSVTSNDLHKSLIALNDKLLRQFHVREESILGSNAWAVSGEHTTSGLPLLASDPHMSLEMPSVWYLAEIQGNRLHVTGATFPGSPVVTMGRNDSVSWGITNMMPDAVDLYVERINPLNPNQYEVDGQWVDMEIEEQLIHVKSATPSFLTDPIPPVEWQVRRTRNGPLISDAIGRVDTPLALRWTILNKEDKTFQSFLKMNYSEDLASFQTALEDYTAPGVNIIYADADNNIAHFAAGKLPIRKNSDGRLPVPGWNSEYDWNGYIPFDAMPHNINPSQGYVISANNKNHPDDYPYIISNSWGAPYRAIRIEQVIRGYLDSGKKIEVRDFVALQGDNYSLQAAELLPFLRNLPTKTSKQEMVIEQLKGWDGVISGESEPAALYEVWLRHFNSLLLSDDLNGSLLNEERGNQLQGMISRLKPKLLKNLLNNSQYLKYNWCDQINTPAQESCDDLALIALDMAINDLDGTFGFGEEWGDIFETYLPHPVLSNNQLLDVIFSRSIPGSGDRFSVKRSDWVYTVENGYRSGLAAAYRQVIDFSDENLSGFINSTGQSGHLMSKHYDDNIVPFDQMKLWPMHTGGKQKPGRESKLTLEPVK